MLQFLTISLRPYLGKLEAEFVRKLCPTQGRKAGKFFIQFDVAGLLRTDLKSQNEAYTAGRIGGWWSANDIRRKIGENPGGPELDVYVAAVNYQNAKRLLDTESLQDQPIGGAEPDPAPTDAERNMLGVYTRSYMTLYSDAFRRLSTRKTKDFDAIQAIFRPVLRSIADTALDKTPGFPDLAGDNIDPIITDTLKSMAKRAAKWDGSIDCFKVAEFNKAVRSIHLAVAREAAVAKAAEQLEEVPEESEDDQAA